MGQLFSPCDSCIQDDVEHVNRRKFIDDNKSQASESSKNNDSIEHSQSDLSFSTLSFPAQSSVESLSIAAANSFDLNKVDSLFEDLAKFMRDLPERSKGHIWKHSVKSKNEDGLKTICDKANDEQLILKLLSDIVIVYVKYLDRNRDPLTTKQVKHHVEPVAKWIFEKYHTIERLQFETDKNYFSNILEAYQGRS